MTGELDYYAILGVDRSASAETIRAVFVDLMGTVPENTSRFTGIKQAYEVLGDAGRREIYDSLLKETNLVQSSLSVKIQSSRDKMNLSPQEQLFYLLINLVPPNHKKEAQRPLNIGLIIDRSTSMQGQRLDHVKTAVRHIVDKLAANDKLTLVSFSDRATLDVPTDSALQARAIMAKVQGIQAAGGTEIFQGLSVGYQAIQQQPLQSYTNHLILLTDGHTYGDEAECLQLAQRAAARNIGISAFGIGDEWNDRFLDELVAPSGGHSSFIAEPREIISHLQKRIKGLGAVYAENMRLTLDFPASIQLREAFKLSPFVQPVQVEDGLLKLGHVESYHALSFLLELTLAPQQMEIRQTIPFKFSGEIPSQQYQTQTFENTFKFTVLRDAPKMDPPPALMEAVRSLNFYRINEKAQNEMANGEVDKATRRMEHLTTRLLEVGETELAAQAQREMQRLAQGEAMSDEGKKRLKYGTRALMQPPDLKDSL